MRLLRGRRPQFSWRRSLARPSGPRVGVIGASHMTALQRAAAAGHGLDGVDVHFQGLGGREFFAITAGRDGLYVDDAKLVLAKGRRRPWGSLDAVLRYDAFDAFVVIGVLRTRFLVGSIVRNGLENYSDRFLRAGIEAVAARDHGFHLAHEIAKRGQPVAVTSAPLPATPRALKRDWEEAYKTVMTLLSEAAARRGVTFVPQPEETLERFAWTRPEFAVGSIRLSGHEHPMTERDHMNERYGAVALPPLLRAVVKADDATRAA